MIARTSRCMYVAATQGCTWARRRSRDTATTRSAETARHTGVERRLNLARARNKRSSQRSNASQSAKKETTGSRLRATGWGDARNVQAAAQRKQRSARKPNAVGAELRAHRLARQSLLHKGNTQAHASPVAVGAEVRAHRLAPVDSQRRRCRRAPHCTPAGEAHLLQCFTGLHSRLQ